METKKRGGVRPGAGRPETGVKRRNIMIEDDLWALATRIGGGNASAGIRRALQEAAKTTT